MLITLQLKRIHGVGIQPNLRNLEISNILQFCQTVMAKRIAFVDLAPTSDILNLIKVLNQKGIKTVLFKDHHADDRKKDLAANALKIFEIMEHSREFLFYPRDNFSTAASMVNPGEWSEKGIDVVFFHDDLGDGWCSFLKGLQKPMIYPHLNEIAENAEGENNYIDEVGILFKKAKSLGPSFFINQERRQVNRRWIYNGILQWLVNGLKKSDFTKMIEDNSTQAKKITQQLINYVEVSSNLVYLDYRHVLKRGEKPDIGLLLYKMFEMGHFKTLIACRVIGNLGDQINISSPNGLMKSKNFSLIDLLPLGSNGWHVDGRIHFPVSEFDQFKKKLNSVM